jgi:hypothetical protein
MKYAALLLGGESQWGGLSVMNEISVELTVRQTLPFGHQVYLFFVKAELPHHKILHNATALLASAKNRPNDQRASRT